MENSSPRSMSTKSNASFVASLSASTQFSTTAHRMVDMKRLVIELSNPDLRANALRVLSKVISNLSFSLLFICFMGFISKPNPVGVVILYNCDLNSLCAPLST